MEYRSRLTVSRNSMQHSSCRSVSREQLWHSRVENGMQGLRKVRRGFSTSSFMLGVRFSLVRCWYGLWPSRRHYLLLHCILYVILGLKDLGVFFASVSFLASRLPLRLCCHPIPFRSSASVRGQQWFVPGSVCSADEELHEEAPLGRLLKVPSPFVVVVAAIAFLLLILSNPDNSWTLTARTRTQSLHLHSAQPFLPSIARWIDLALMPMSQYFFWRRHNPSTMSTATKGCNRMKGLNFPRPRLGRKWRRSKPRLGRKRFRPPAVFSLRRHLRPNRLIPSLTPPLLRRNSVDSGGIRLSKRNRRSSWPPGQNHQPHRLSGFNSAFGSYF